VPASFQSALRALLRASAWAVPVLCHAGDAYAWGLCTHMYFSQLLVWAVPLADPRFRAAVARFPELVLAAACLPDVSLFSRPLSAASLRCTHLWSSAARMLRGGRSDQERAMALGYAAHLLTDIVAHHYFVPAHEAAWSRRGMLVHAASEWAMDAHLERELFARPAALIARNEATLAAFADTQLHVEGGLARRALRFLARGEALLRASGTPGLVYRAARRRDAALPRRYDEYIAQTADRLGQINRLIDGDIPAWVPEPAPDERPELPPALPHSSPYVALLPKDFFRDLSDR
jgi:hypothetical protein